MEPAAGPYGSEHGTAAMDDPIKMEGGLSHGGHSDSRSNNDNSSNDVAHPGKDFEPVPLVHHHHPPQHHPLMMGDGSSHHPHHAHHQQHSDMYRPMDDSRKMMAYPQHHHLHPNPHHHLYAEPKKVSESKQQVWLEFLEKLKAYKRTYGNCVVPRGYEEPRLANWVCEQRKQFKLLKDGRKSNITDERIRMLNELGFAWNAQEAAWESHFTDMQAFKEANGHCLVPENHEQYPKLYVWQKEQRRHHSLKIQGKPTHMTDERYERLCSIGFCWDHRDSVWSTRLEQLRQYKAQHGDCLVPAEYQQNPKLGRWVKQQRKEYKKYCQGKPSQINEFRIGALDRIGFSWQALKFRTKKEVEDEEVRLREQSLQIAAQASANAALLGNSSDMGPTKGPAALGHLTHQLAQQAPPELDPQGMAQNIKLDNSTNNRDESPLTYATFPSEENKHPVPPDGDTQGASKRLKTDDLSHLLPL